VSAPDLSVIIPTYRRPAALETTLRALTSQRTDTRFEVVVCDDGSPEAEAAQYRRLMETQVHLDARLVRQENAGPAAARNTGARAARGSLLLFLDDDCAPSPDLLEVHLRTHTACAEHGLGVGRDPAKPGDRGQIAVMGHVAWSPAVRVTPFMELVVRGAQFNYGAIADPDQVPFTCFYTANCSLARSALERAGWFDASLPPFMEDTEFAYRLTRSGTRIVYRPQAVVHHEHTVELAPYLERQRKAGRAAVEVARRHPELFDIVGVSDVADISLREQFYTALLRYAFVCGVEEGLQEEVSRGAITASELRGQFDAWTAHWAVHQAGQLRAWRERAEALTQELARRDAKISALTIQKDDRIAALEAQLGRFNRLLPIRVYQLMRRSLWTLGHKRTAAQ
jgi:GT2 family glycosyltransferase